MSTKRLETMWDIGRLNVWFLVSSALLVGTTILLVVKDYARPWKKYQRTWMTEELVQTQAAVQNALPAADLKKLQDLDDQMQKEEAAQRSGIRSIEDQVGDLKADLYLDNQKFQFRKAELDTARYEFEEFRHKHERDEPDAVSRRMKELEELDREVRQLEDQYKGRELKVAALEAEKKKLLTNVSRMREEHSTITKDKDALQRKLAKFEPSFPNRFRNWILVDFISPTIKVQKFVINDLYDDLNFDIKVPKIDMCTTCHVSIKDPRYADPQKYPNPLRAHPRLDLFMADTSPHPSDSFGCTICHMGHGQSLTFEKAAHTPRSREQAERWEKEHHWHPYHYWDLPMVPMDRIQSSCVKCHKEEFQVPGAPEATHGKLLVKKLGCQGCHPWKGFENERKVGPDLRKLANKTTPEWTFQWVKNPLDFRPTTRMPRFFGIRHDNDEKLDDVQVRALTQYLFAHAERTTLEAPPADVTGDAKRGEDLFWKVGCLGCHSLRGADGRQVVAGGESLAAAPDLSRIGSKVNAAWLYDWLRDPGRHFPDTRMPNLRLTPQEAADLVAWLTTLKDPGEAGRYRVADVEDRVRDELVFTYQKGNLTEKEAHEQTRRMSADEKDLFLGERLFRRYGCAGCHLVTGHERDKGIGTELSEVGSKDVETIDLGLTDTPKTIQDWLPAKIREPRIFDEGRIKGFEDRSRMPRFSLTDEELHDLVTFTMGNRKDLIAPNRLRSLKGHLKGRETGERLVWEYNCTGCHRFHMDEVVYETTWQDKGKERTGALRLEGLVAVDEPEELTFQAWVDEPRLGLHVGDPVAIPKAKVKSLTKRDQPGQYLREAEIAAHLTRHLVKVGEVESEDVAGPFMPPVLYGEGRKVQSPWVFQFLRAPVTLRPWLKVRMPTFPFHESESEALAHYFAAAAQEPYPFQFMPEKEEAALAAKDRARPGRIDHASKLFNSETVNCGKCHVRGKINPPGDPSDWAPDLTLAQVRLRPNWIRRWLSDPQRVQPGTKMPTFFPEGEQRYQDLFPAPKEEQIDALVDFLMNFPATR